MFEGTMPLSTNMFYVILASMKSTALLCLKLGSKNFMRLSDSDIVATFDTKFEPGLIDIWLLEFKTSNFMPAANSTSNTSLSCRFSESDN